MDGRPAFNPLGAFGGQALADTKVKLGSFSDTGWIADNISISPEHNRKRLMLNERIQRLTDFLNEQRTA